MFIRMLLMFLILFPTLNLQARDYEGPFDMLVFERFKREEAKVYIPLNYDSNKSYPLVFSLHGDLSSPGFQNRFFPLHKLVTEKQFILVVPFAMKDIKGIRGWNYGDWNENFDYEANVDDVYYISKLIDILSAAYTVDTKKIIMAGHSGGGFMAYKLACEIPERISAIVSFAGGRFNDLNDCKKKVPVSTLQIHGTTDSFVPIEGTENYPSAIDTVKIQASLSKCNTEDPEVKHNPIDKSTVYNFKNCPDKKNYQLWVTEGRGHVYFSALDFLVDVLDWSFAQK